jgi:hypothetical protein
MNLGTFYATCEDNSIRDPIKALQFATKACELQRWKESKTLEALARVHFLTGDHLNAIKYQRMAVDCASFKRIQEARERLAAYEAKVDVDGALK